jgi:CHAT domain-containing protein
MVGDVDYGSDPGKPQLLAEATQRAGPFSEWSALSGTAAEIAAIGRRFKRTFPDSTLAELSEGQATEEAFREKVAKHRYLHVATHGFFAPEKIKSALAFAATDRLASAEPFTGKPAPGIHPGLLSGLVLAGANRPADPDKDDGILTSLEVAGLDLGKVELAVLSACETGLGEVAGGEGVLGLQRAFQTAGARSVVASLWKVDDKATRQLMIDFYDNLWQKKMAKAEALRQAQLKMLREGAQDRGLVKIEQPVGKDQRMPPYYWAGFVLSGDWR